MSWCSRRALDDELRELGFLRELLTRVQTVRKEMGLEFVDRIVLGFVGQDRRLAGVLAKHTAELVEGSASPSASSGDPPRAAATSTSKVRT